MNWRLYSLGAAGFVGGVGAIVGGGALLGDRLADSRADDRVAAAIDGYELGAVHAGDGAHIDELIEQALSKSASNRDCPFPEEPEPLPVAARVDAELVGRFDQPTWVTVDASGRELVVERAGRVLDLETGAVVVDVSATTRVEHDSGLMGAVVDGDWIYLYQSSWITPTSGARSTRILAASLAGAPPGAAPVTLFETRVPTGQHAGGGIAIGPDGMLWLGLGDGGGLGDPRANAQDPTVLLGKLLRIDPRPDIGGYDIPPDNPFADPDDGVADEIVALGLRNPWRLSFDREPVDATSIRGPITGGLWFGDVGQSCWEEIDVIPDPTTLDAPNFGWDAREAFEPFQVAPVTPEEEIEFVEPVHAYHHRGGHCAVATGYVYRANGALADVVPGALLFTDYCGDEVYAFVQGRTVPSVVSLGVEIPTPVAVVPDSDGEPLVVSLWSDGETQEGGAVYRLR